MTLAQASAQSYGTKVDEEWYDTIAEVYQNPTGGRAVADDDRETCWQYEGTYSLSVDRIRNADFTLAFEPQPGAGADCVLYGTAGLAELYMRTWVSLLGNLTGGPGATEFKERLLNYAAADLIALKSDFLLAAATVEGIRYPPYAYLPVSPAGTNFMFHYFSIPELQALGVIENDSVTIAFGPGRADRCVFDLTQLP